jgi:hypothetical protein
VGGDESVQLYHRDRPALCAAIEPVDDVFDAKRYRRAVTTEIELENELDRLGFNGING